MNDNQTRFGGNMGSHHGRSLSNSTQGHNPYSYDSSSRRSPLGSNAPSNATLVPRSARKEEYMDDGDVTMEDADPYNRMKYPSRPAHARASSHHLSQEESSAARRYSPMSTFSPTSPYVVNSPHQSNYSHTTYTPNSQSARQSPSKSNNQYATPSNQYYSSNGKFAQNSICAHY